jgi:type II secretory pathway component PulF
MPSVMSDKPDREPERVTRWIPLVVPMMAVTLALVIYFIFSSVVAPLGA